MSNADLFQKVKNLHLPRGEYALFGSAPMGMRRLKECRDVDVLVTKALWNMYKNRGWEVRVMPHGSQYLWKDGIELWEDWYPGYWDVEKLIQDAETIDGLACVRLQEVIKWKKLRHTEKDLKDAESVEKFLRKG